MRYGIACGALVLMTVLPLATFGVLALTSNGTPHSITASAGQRFAVVGAPGGFGETDSVVEKITAELDGLLPWVLVAWCVGVVLFLVRLNVGLMVARRIKLLATQRVPVELWEAFMELKAALGICATCAADALCAGAGADRDWLASTGSADSGGMPGGNVAGTD
jgi:hypothetical protein